MAIVLQNVSYKHSPYDKEYFFKNINLEIEENRICGIIGNSGSGKTTLLGLMSGINKRNRICIKKLWYKKKQGKRSIKSSWIK